MQHVHIAEKALGKPLPEDAQVHHINGNKADNRPENLIICDNQKYHQLLHLRQKALEACGHADWRKCTYCKRWDEPSALKTYDENGEGSYHGRCKYQLALKVKRRSSQQREAPGAQTESHSPSQQKDEQTELPTEGENNISLFLTASGLQKGH